MGTTDSAREDSSPLALAVLTLLAEKPRHPYEMQTTIRERHVQRVVKMRGGSLYDTVRRLDNAGLIEQTGTTRAGARPERTVYALTERGSERLHAMMEEFLGEPVNEYPRFVAALAHLAVVEPARATTLLRRRADRLQAEDDSTSALLRDADATHPRVVLLEEEYAQMLRRAEIRWLRQVADDIERGQLPWPTADT